ncbi:hypothetical protein BU23DRAFT_457667, partial [Bimuria novae-zelandiae CBS 107.79]
ITTYLRRTKLHLTGLVVAATKLRVVKQTYTPQLYRLVRFDLLVASSARNYVCKKKHWYTNYFILNLRHPQRPKDY